MDPRRLLHPLPFILVALFVAVAIGDFVQDAGEEPQPPPKVFGSHTPRFRVWEPVIDLRPGRTDPAIELLPVTELVGGQWSAPGRRGVWARGPAAELAIDLEPGGHRVLVVDGLPAGGKRPVRTLNVAVNGVDCGSVAVEPGWHRHVFELPETTVRAGRNRVVFEFPDRAEADVRRRALLIRRFGLFFDPASDAETLNTRKPLVVDAAAGRVAIRRSGLFELPMTLDDRTDALKMRFRFPSNAGRAELVVAKRGDGVDGSGKIVTVGLDAAREPSGRVRIPLHGRRGEFLFRVDVDLGSSDNVLLISSLRLVEEGDPSPSGRQSVRSPSPS